MIIIWVASAVLVLSILGIGAILVRKFPLAAGVDPDRTPVAETKKAEIIESRLRRKFAGLWNVIQERSRPILGRTGGLLSKTQAKLRDLEHEYRARSLPVLLDRHQRHRLNAEIQVIIEQAEACINDSELKAAEEKCLQAIRMEPRSIPAFELLGGIYLRTKEFAHAKEVYRFLEKLVVEPDAIFDHRSDEANALSREQGATAQIRYQEYLAESFQGLDDLPAAFTAIQEAYRLAPTNPKVLDTYIEIAIALGKKAFAASALDQLRSVNPENTKIVDWETTIANLPDTHLTSDESAPPTTITPL